MQGKIGKKSTGWICAAALLCWPACAQAEEAGGEAVPSEAATEFSLDDLVVVAARQKEAPRRREDAFAYAGGQAVRKVHLGILGDKDFMDVPFSVTGYTAEAMANQQAASLSDIIVNDASVSDQTLSSASSAWNIRGFKTTQQDVQLNGLYGVAPRFYSGLEAVERVEIIKGPSALLGGLPPNGTVGGTINFVTKRAADTPIRRVTLSLGEGNAFTQQVDIGERFHDGKYGIRLNVLNRGGGETASPHEFNTASTAALGLDARGRHSSVSVDLGYAYNRIDNPQYRVTFADAFLQQATAMLPVPDHAKFGADGTYRTVVERYGMVHGERELGKGWMAYLSSGMRLTSMDYLYNEFRLNNASGDARVRYRYNNQVNRADSVEAGLRGRTRWGRMTNELQLGMSRIHYTRYMSNRILNNYVTSYYRPSWNPVEGELDWREPKNDENTLVGVSLADTLTSPDGAWSFLAGVRYQDAKVENFYNATGSTVNPASRYAESAWSPAFGIVHRLGPHASLYANYTEGLECGTTVTDTSAANYGESFGPYKTKQYEAGAKFDLGKFGTTWGLFRIEQPSLIEDAATARYALNGTERHRGVEWSFFGEPHRGTRLLGGVTYLDASYGTTAGGTYDGKRVSGTSRWTAVLGIEQDLPHVPGFTLTGRMIYNSPAYANEANTLRVPSWTRWNLGARYAFRAGGVPLTIRLDVRNVFNKKYWHALDNAVFVGTARTCMLSLTADF